MEVHFIMKRFLALALCLLLACPAAMAEVFPVSYYGAEESEGYALLLADDGTVLTPPQVYGNIYRLTPEGTPTEQRRYAAEPITPNADIGDSDPCDLDYKAYNRVALMGPDGALLTGFDYWSLQWSNGMCRVSVPIASEACTGAIDPDGRLVVEPKYMDVEYMGDGRWLAIAYPTDEALPEDGGLMVYPLVLLDENGVESDLAIHTTSPYLPADTGSLCPVESVQEFGGQAVYIDRDGRVCFGRSFEDASAFEGNCASVRVDDKAGLIGRDGAFLAEPEFDYIYHDGDDDGGVFIGHRGTELAVYDVLTGEERMRMDFAPADYAYASVFTPNLLWVYTDENQYVYSMDGTQLAAFETEEGADIQYTRCTDAAPRLVRTTGEWPYSEARLIDLEGNPVGGVYQGINESLWSGTEGRYAINAYEVTEKNGEPTIDWRTWRNGVIDENGEIVLEPRYTGYIQALSTDRFWVSTNERTGMVDENGDWLYAIDDYASLMD